MTSSESSKESYDRGVVAGGVEQRLAGHDKHFAAINGSLDRISGTLKEFLVKQNEMMLEIQRLTQDIVSMRETEIAKLNTQVAIPWSPWLQLLVVVAGIGIVIGMVAGIIAIIN